MSNYLSYNKDSLTVTTTKPIDCMVGTLEDVLRGMHNGDSVCCVIDNSIDLLSDDDYLSELDGCIYCIGQVVDTLEEAGLL